MTQSRTKRTIDEVILWWIRHPKWGSYSHGLAALGYLERLKDLESFVDSVAAYQTDEDLDGDLSGDKAITAIGEVVGFARNLKETRHE